MSILKYCLKQLGVVAHVCNPSYLGSRDQEDQGLRPAWQKISETPISTNKLGRVVCTCVPSYE
jgi:hypothetical protein